jgi:phosphate-selective porin
MPSILDNASIRTMRKLVTAASVAAAAVAVAVTTPATAGTTGAHWCRQGDPPLYASARTECRLAGKVITDYVNVCRESRSCVVRVASSDSRRAYRVTCHRAGRRYSGVVSCTAPPASGIWVRFSAVI